MIEKLLAVVVCVCAVGFSYRPAHALDKDALADHIRESLNLPGAVEMSFDEPRPSDIPGLDVLGLRMSLGRQKREEKVYLSKDGRYYSLGAFRDISVKPDQERLARMDLKDPAWKGASGAPVTVVQYTDFQCPYCQKGFEIMRDRVLKDYPKQVRWVYRAMPLSFHPWAEPAAVAVECARLQSLEKFWALHDKLFEKQRELTSENLEQKLQEYAKEAKLRTKDFQACREANKTLVTVRRDASEAEAVGITGTPAFVVNGHLVSGADYGEIKRIIDESLVGKHGKP